ncbi:MAG: hypothetical protein JSR41_19965 [Proteobacteria bacterium]|nr:hypothetical protein [Pseudomonadota bacterium]
MSRLSFWLRSAGAGVLLCMSLHGHATSIFFDLGESARNADFVGEVEIISGAQLSVSANGDGGTSESCGVVYTAVVRTAVKGAQVGETIKFGRYTGRGIGARYVVFLSTAGGRLDSTYGAYRDPLLNLPPGAEAAARQRCEAQLPALRETGQGLGTLPIEYLPRQSRAGYETGVALSTQRYRVAADLPGMCGNGDSVADRGQRICFGVPFEVKTKDLLQWLSKAMEDTRR